MLEALGQYLYSGLCDVVGGVARRTGDALLGPRVDDSARRPLVDHRLGKGMDAVYDSPEIDAEHLLPALVMIPWPAARRGACVIHEYGDLPEFGVGAFFQAPNVLHSADIDRHLDDRSAGQLGGCLVERVLTQVGEAKLHPHGREPSRCSEADPAGATGDHGNAVFAERWMVLHHNSLAFDPIARPES